MRAAVRRFLAIHNTGDSIAVACSGGADSLALAAATVHHAERLGLAVHGLVVDHQLQPGSAQVAQSAAQALRRLGATTVRVLQTTVDGSWWAGSGGPPGQVRGAARSRAGRGPGTARPHPG